MGKKNWVILLLVFVILICGFPSTSANPPAKIVSALVSNVVSALFKWLWSLKPTTKTAAIPSRSMMKFESGYSVETVFDGSKLGIEPYSVEVSPAGEILVLDSENSNIYKISMPLSRYSRPKLVAGSPEGYSGHVDGRPREARMNHPKGLTLDDKGNIYVADTVNMAIRKISDSGVVTIAGGTWGRGGGHVDGPSEDAKFSDDFDVVYVGSSCSLLVIDRGNQAIREIQLHESDCSYKDESNLHLGIAVLVAAAFFGYMLALLQRRIASIFSSHDVDERAYNMKGIQPPPYQRPQKLPVRPSLIPTEPEPEKQEDGFFGSFVFRFLGGLFSGFRRNPTRHHIQQQQYNYHQPTSHSSNYNGWPMQQESFLIPDSDEPPPPLEPRDPTPRRKRHHIQHQPQQHYNHHQRYQSAVPQTYYEQSCETTTTNEIVFGAVQEEVGRREAVVIKALDYGDPMYNGHNIRSRYNYMGMGYSYGY